MSENDMGVYVNDAGHKRAPWRIDVPDPPRVGDPWISISQSKHSVVPDGTVIELLTPEEFATLEDGTRLISIFGEEAEKGSDEIDDETRGGFLAWGLVRVKGLVWTAKE